MSLIKQSLPEDYSVLTGQELEPDYPSDLDYLMNELSNVSLKIAKLNGLTGYEYDLAKIIEMLTLALDVHKLNTRLNNEKAPF